MRFRVEVSTGWFQIDMYLDDSVGCELISMTYNWLGALNFTLILGGF